MQRGDAAEPGPRPAEGRRRLEEWPGRLHCPGRDPPFLAVKRTAPPHKTAIQSRFTVETLRALNRRGRARTVVGVEEDLLSLGAERAHELELEHAGLRGGLVLEVAEENRELLVDEPAVDVALERAAVAVLGETEDLSTSEVSSRHLWGRLKRVDRGSAAVGRRVGAGCRGGR